MLDAEFQGSYQYNSRELYDIGRYATSPTQDRSLNNDDASRFHRVSPHLQVKQMIQYAREPSRVAGDKSVTTTPTTDAPFLTFRQFCVFATELKKLLEREISRPTPTRKTNERKISKPGSNCEVFLGGSCNPTTWRQDIAIPALKKLGITYYNPQVPHWRPELIELEHQAKQTAALHFFVIDGQTRGVASIIEVAYLAASHGKLILVVLPLDGPEQLVSGEPITKQEFDDIQLAQTVLKDLMHRIEIPVFSSVSPALDYAAKVLRDKRSSQDNERNSGNSQIPLRSKLPRKLREAFDALDTANCGPLSFDDVCMAFRILTDRDLSVDDLKRIAACNNEQTSVNFDQFCCILADFWSNPTDNKCSWEALVDKAATLLQSVVFPVSRVLSWALAGQSQSYAPELVVGGTKDVYLGGSCGSSAWRELVAIPMLKKHGLGYFNPQMRSWDQRLLTSQAAAIDSSRVLLFVITGETRSLTAMTLAAHYIGLGYNVVLCIQYLLDNCEIRGEKLTRTAIKDYNRGRSYLCDMAKREGVAVFEDIVQAVDCAVQRCKQQPR